MAVLLVIRTLADQHLRFNTLLTVTMSAAKAALALLLITPFQPSLFEGDSCLVNKFYGNYGDGQQTLSVLIPDASCLETWPSHPFASSASIAQASNEIQQLVWLEEQAVDDALKTNKPSFINELDSFLGALAHIPSFAADVLHSGQEVLNMPISQPGYELFYRSSSAALLSVSHDKARIIDTIIPRFWRSTLLPNYPVSFLPVPEYAVRRVEDISRKLKFDPNIASIVNNISLAQMRNDIRFLTGEDEQSGIVSRHSFTPGALTAANWLKARFEDTGATCELKPFLIGFAPNVIWYIYFCIIIPKLTLCIYSSRYFAVTETTATVLLSAHYDSRGSFGMTRAPGGDDDGSGTTALLAIARTIARKGIKFLSNVELIAFAGEEQGLLGSRAYSSTPTLFHRPCRPY